VKQSGGHVKIYSEVGQGTTIKVYLPRFYSETAAEEEETSGPAIRGAQHETVLVVEDDADVRTFTIEALRELGYRVLEASHANAALHLLEGHPEILVLFTDVGLPGGMNGRQLAEAARARRSDVKVLFTTGYARNAIVHDGRLDPGVELITKPFTQAALAAKLRDVIDARATPARVLVVEDEVMIQMLAAEYLEEAGLKVEVAGSATDAMNKLRLIPGSVDAVIVDVGLPDRRGDALVREIRTIYPSLPVVLATGYDPSDMQRSFQNDAKIAFVSKPYTADVLKAAMRRFGILNSANGKSPSRESDH
jgi:CheY-like chemotaxis protein